MKFTASVGEALMVLIGLAVLALIGSIIYDSFASILVLGDWR